MGAGRASWLNGGGGDVVIYTRMLSPRRGAAHKYFE